MSGSDRCDEFLDPILSDYKKRFDERLAQEARNIQQRQDAELTEKNLKSSLFKDDKFNPVRFVDLIIKSYLAGTFITPTNDQGGDVIFRYDPNTGIFRNDGIPWIEAQLRNILGEDTTNAHYHSVVKHLQVATYTDPKDFVENPYIVVLKNGSFNLLTGELGEHSPENKAKNVLPVIYNPKATCPNFLKFIERLLPKPEFVKFWQEWMGYNLLKDYRFQRVVVLVGEGDNGKSTLLIVFTSWLGPENVASETLLRLSTIRFSPSELYCKLANVCADIGPDELKHTGIVKTLTGNDRITAERKNRDPFQFKNYAKLTFSCNQVPQTPDETLAFYKRFVVLLTGDPIPPENQNPTLKDKLTTPEELSGIFNWAYEGLKTALDRGALAEPSDIQTRKELYQNMSKPEYGFYNEYIEEDRESYEIKQDVINAFYQYCKNKGFVPLSERTFIERFKKLAYVREYHPKLWTEENPKAKGKQYACWRGIKLGGNFRKTVYYTSRNDYLATVKTQKHIWDIEDIEGPHTAKIDPALIEELKDPLYGQYGQCKQLVEDAKAFLAKMGGRAEVSILKDHLMGKGYTEADISEHVTNNWKEFYRPSSWHISLK